MEKRNTLLLTVIAIATLLVAVAGSTFAYFAGSQTTSNVVNVSATTPASTTTFYTTKTADISFTLTEAQMQKSNEGNVVFDKTETLSAVLKTSSSTAVFCTYDVVFAWTGTQYTPTNAAMEFTVQATTPTVTGAVTSGTPATSVHAITEQNITATNILTGEKLVVTNGTGTVAYALHVKFYNTTSDQSGLAGKTFAGQFKIANVQC